MAFQDPFPGMKPERKMTEAEQVRALRLDLASEEEAISTYMAHVDATDDTLMQIVLTSIADEERVHAGELQTLINVINGDEFTQQNKGMKEVADVAGSTAAPQ